MYVLRGISPRLPSIVRNNDLGKVIPSFSVLVVLTILIWMFSTFYKICKHTGAYSMSYAYTTTSPSLLNCAQDSNRVMKLMQVKVDGKDVSSDIVRQTTSQPFNS